MFGKHFVFVGENNRTNTLGTENETNTFSLPQQGYMRFEDCVQFKLLLKVLVNFQDGKKDNTDYRKKGLRSVCGV